MPPRPSQPAHHDTSPAGCVLVTKILSGFNVPPADLAAYVGSSLVTIVRWSRGDLNPSPTVMPRLAEALSLLERGGRLKTNSSAAAPSSLRAVLGSVYTSLPSSAATFL